MILLAGAVLAAVPATGHAASQPERQLEAVQEELERSRDREKALRTKAAELAREIAALKKELVKAARATQDTEEELSALEARLEALKERERTLRAALGSREEQMVTVLMGLQRLAWRPSEALLVQPMPSEDVVRSAVLLRSVVPALREKAEGLRVELASLAAVRRAIIAKREEIGHAAQRLDKQHARLSSLLDRKAALRRTTEAEQRAAAKRANALARDAANLRDLVNRLEKERKRRAAEAARLAALAVRKPKSGSDAPAPGRKPDAAPARLETAALPPARSLESMRGAMPMPVRGRIVTRYGEPNGLGATSKGVVVATRPQAQVIAPGDGVVAFAGPFRGYGQLLIIEHGEGYHTLLSGMARIDAVVGQRLLSGEPVGVMGPSGSETLYVEIRRDGQPVNPLPWLSAGKG